MRNSGANAVLSLDINGTEQLALTKAITVHPVKRTLTHLDLIVIRRGEGDRRGPGPTSRARPPPAPW